MSAKQQVHQDNHEPLSGVKGKGTAQEPFDKGNEEDMSKSGEEPVSGVQGEGTKDQPFDAGNDTEVQEKMK
ncbi:MAG: hypothetical protein M1828_005831 [Chrysothrix sp. TS-e1954]|nr:MAG: hypothetical protein M1828_005831 [Chrysothrix sp. TS-e1954]